MRHPVKPGGRVVCLGQRWLQYYHLSYVVFLLKQVWLYETHEVRVVTEEEEGFPAFFLVFTLHCLLGLARHGFRPASHALVASEAIPSCRYIE